MIEGSLVSVWIASGHARVSRVTARAREPFLFVYYVAVTTRANAHASRYVQQMIIFAKRDCQRELLNTLQKIQTYNFCSVTCFASLLQLYTL